MKNFEEFSTMFVQEVGSKEGAVSPAITSSASFSYGTAEIAEGIFDGSVKKPLYSRMGNPTSSRLETIMAKMDSGAGAVATSSGMGATALATMSLLESGDEIISVGGLFGGTYAYFNETLKRFGVKTHFFHIDDYKAIENTINEKTKFIFTETIGNPNMRLVNLTKIADIANKAGVALIVDNTITPMALQPLLLGADIVVYSTTKIISGNASALGGCAVFRAIKENDKFKSPRYKFLENFIKNMGNMALIANAKKRVLRDFGMSASPHASYQTMLGLETLPLRMERISKTTEIVALALKEHGFKVNHPVLSSHPDHELYKKEYKNGCGTLLTLDFGTKKQAFDFLNKTKIATLTANIGDSRTLALHMASTIYRDFNKNEWEFLGITDGLIRISIGLENPQDIIDDFITCHKNSL